jgi:Bacterial mobilisation protein (MobC)
MDRTTYQREYRQKYKAQAKRVNLTFDVAEHRSLSRAAKSSGEPMAAYVKRMAMAAHHDHADASVPEDVLEELSDLSRVIRTIANNVNQMARHSNRIGQVLDEQEVFLHIQRLEAELRGAVAKSSRGAGQRRDAGAG